jgi:hypothetical protein
MRHGNLFCDNVIFPLLQKRGNQELKQENIFRHCEAQSAAAIHILQQ